jgi:hypothetical protein
MALFSEEDGDEVCVPMSNRIKALSSATLSKSFPMNPQNSIHLTLDSS